MDELKQRENGDMSALDGLAVEARLYSESIAMNMIQLGRVFTEAKKLVKRGEWGAWLRNNSGCSERTAQQFMQGYSRFGSNEACMRIEKSKLFKMLALPEGGEDAFLQEHDVSDMTSREVEAAVRKERERAERAEAEVKALKNRPPEIPDDVSKALREKDGFIERQKAELEQVACAGKETLSEANKLRAENGRLKRELDESSQLLEDTQEECNRAQAELLNMQSALAKGDAERVPSDELTTDAFASSVRQFIGSCARMPYMGRAFSAMHQEERQAFDELLRTIEGWAKESRKALETVFVEVTDI